MSKRIFSEGLADGVWVPYEFPCKVGAVDRRPCVIAPWDLPIDWSLWFVPLGNVNHHPWFFVLLCAGRLWARREP